MKPEPSFEWDEAKDRGQPRKGAGGFFDPHSVIAEDLDHSGGEPRYFCFGTVEGGVMTVRFTYRAGRVRIFGAGYWRKGKRIYEQQNR